MSALFRKDGEGGNLPDSCQCIELVENKMACHRNRNLNIHGTVRGACVSKVQRTECHNRKQKNKRIRFWMLAGRIETRAWTKGIETHQRMYVTELCGSV